MNASHCVVDDDRKLGESLAKALPLSAVSGIHVALERTRSLHARLGVDAITGAYVLAKEHLHEEIDALGRALLQDAPAEVRADWERTEHFLSGVRESFFAEASP